VGDFNFIRALGEKRGISNAVGYSREIEGFNSFIEKAGILDISMVGRKYTWYISQMELLRAELIGFWYQANSWKRGQKANSSYWGERFLTIVLLFLKFLVLIGVLNHFGH